MAYFRVGYRLLLLGIAIVLQLTELGWMKLRGAASTRQRARWLHETVRIGLRIVHVRVDSRGKAPKRGLLVSNHLSYLDILVLGSLAPCVFVSRHDVRDWPIFGLFARLSGTLFIDRRIKSEVGRVKEEMGAILDSGQVVVLFPEGTSSDGETLLPFKTSLFQPVVDLNCPISLSWISYALKEGNAKQEVCYWGDAIFAPHLLRLLGKKEIVAHVDFWEAENMQRKDRKQLAGELREQMLRFQENLKP